MSTSRGIHNIVSPYPMGDVERYFVKLDHMIGTNSGKKNYDMCTHSCYATSAPFNAHTPTKFRLTDNNWDIIDISQGLIEFKIKFDLLFRHQHKHQPTVSAGNFYANWYFIGLKSGAHIIENYAVYSNGRLTSCKQVKGVEEQAIVFNCKSKEQIKSRPGVYSAHEDVLKMNDCVCGFYIHQPQCLMNNGEYLITDNELTVLIQVDDLLPFSGMRYFPRFACGDLEIEITPTIEKNFVFCPIPYETVFDKYCYKTTELYSEKSTTQLKHITNQKDVVTYGTDHQPFDYYEYNDIHGICEVVKDSDYDYADEDQLNDYRYHQCGEYCRTTLAVCNAYTNYTSGEKDPKANNNRSYPVKDNDVGYWVAGIVTTIYSSDDNKVDDDKTRDETNHPEFLDTDITFIPQNLTVIEAKSYVYGFDIKEEAKKNILTIFKQQQKLIIPAQWINHQVFNQLPGTQSIKVHMNLPLYECSELILTFPNNENQRTVSRNPYFQNVKCQLDSKIFPDKDMTTIEYSAAEMTMTTLGFDSYFSASDELTKALYPPQIKTNKEWFYKMNDDSAYMFVMDLERNGAGVHHDGYSNQNALINFDANYIGGNENPHFYEKHRITNPNYNSAKEESYVSGDNYNPATVINSDLKQIPPNLYTVCDAYWLFTPNGGEFMKEGAAYRLAKEKEVTIALNHLQ